MYSVEKDYTEQYGNVIKINRCTESSFETPFQAFNQALTLLRLWKDGGKIRFLVNGQILTKKQTEKWSNEEYKSLPKCENCAKILSGSIYTHSLSRGYIFCTQGCADKDYVFKVEQLEDERECDFR